MTADPAALVSWAPAFILVLARVGATMAVLPGLGEAAAPAIVRIGMALAVTVLLLPELQPAMLPVPETGLNMGLMIAGEVVTGLWFGWIARMIALALPIGAQFIGYMIGLSTVLQPDPELGAQTGVLGKLFEMVVPTVMLVSGLYRLPLTALHGLFAFIPAGHMLPLDDGGEMVVRFMATGFSLALQLASPFIVLAVVWHLAIGLATRIMTRMQIYFISMPGQIMAGLALLAVATSAIVLAWQETMQTVLSDLPGAG